MYKHANNNECLECLDDKMSFSIDMNEFEGENFDSENDQPQPKKEDIDDESKDKQINTETYLSDKDMSNQLKILVQKTIAEQFLTFGFGYIINSSAIKKKHQVLICANYYNNTMSAVVRKGFRALENFLIDECKQKIKRLTHAEGNLLRSPMIQCTKWLGKDELNCFYKFIIRVYDIKGVKITEDAASRLYGQLLQAAKKGHQVEYLLLHRNRKKTDPKQHEGLNFAYVPSQMISSKR